MQGRDLFVELITALVKTFQPLSQGRAHQCFFDHLCINHRRRNLDLLHHIEQLSKVDVAGIEPSAHAFAVHNVWQEDVARSGLPVDQALRNAPAQRDHMVVVPKVVE